MSFIAQSSGGRRSWPRNHYCGRPLRFSTVLLWALLAPASLFAQATHTNLEDQIPPLRPPRGELPPSFWEQHGTSVLLASFAAVLLVALAIWLLTLRRPAVAPLPEVVARQALEKLRTQPENGLLLSRVSQILRRYLKAAFEMSPVESTTTEFCEEIAANERVGPELAGQVSSFLRRCDERKFGPAEPAPELGALAQALKLVDAGEARRAGLRAAAESASPPELQKPA